jgi:hypothetical protein
MKLGSCILINVIAASIFGCATDHSPSDLKFEPAPPTESQALPMSTKYHTKADVLSGLGTPKSKVVLVPSGSSQCVERWFYIGKVNVGFGPIDMMTYVDFDDAENICKSSAST